MFSYAAGQTSPHGPKGIASYPWDWLIDLKPINYLERHGDQRQLDDRDRPFPRADQPADPALRRPGAGARARTRAGAADSRSTPSPWHGSAARWLPFAALSLFWQRTSYLYYMVIVMPGIYLALARLFSRPRMPRWALGGWLGLVAAAAVLCYPFVAGTRRSACERPALPVPPVIAEKRENGGVFRWTGAALRVIVVGVLLAVLAMAGAGSPRLG